MLRRILFMALVGVVSQQVMAQSLSDAQKQIYYQRWSSAEKMLNNVIEKDPSNLDAYYWLSQVYLQENDSANASKAIAAAQKVIEQNSKLKKKEAIIQAGQVNLLIVAGDTTEAKTQSEALVKETKAKKSDILLALARAYLDPKFGNYQYALALLDKAVSRDKKNPEVYALTGDAWRRLGNGGKAVSSYMAALNVDPSYARANYSIGKIYMTQNNYSLYLKYFMAALNQDQAYAPVLYELFYYYYYRDVNEAKRYLDKFIANTDPSIDNDYMMDDLLFVSQKYPQAIDKGEEILQKMGDKTEPRIYKLIAYSYDALGDSVKALKNLDQYFDKEVDSNYVAKDYELKAGLVKKVEKDSAQAADLLKKAVAIDTVPSEKVGFMTKIYKYYKKVGNAGQEAYWLGRIYQTKPNPSNLDLYYWGVANYAAQEYGQCDSVFAIYTDKYPEQLYGYLWRAKANAMIDSTMETGAAVPYYQKLVDIAGADSLKNKTLLIQAYGYIGAYEANVKKEYKDALTNFEKILSLDPGNPDAEKYRDILKGWIKPESEN